MSIPNSVPYKAVHRANPKLLCRNSEEKALKVKNHIFFPGFPFPSLPSIPSPETSSPFPTPHIPPGERPFFLPPLGQMVFAF